MGKQIPLDLAIAPDFSAGAYLHNSSNAEARAALNHPEKWANHTLALIGPKGSGKTHLGHIWAEQHAAIKLGGRESFTPRTAWQDKALWIDNAASADEFTLFTVINLAITDGLKALLLTDQNLPAAWPAQIPDLRSRLKNLQTVRLHEPDDVLLTMIINKLFKDRGLKVSPSLTSYLLTNTERSVNALRTLIAKLDHASASEKVNVTRAFAAKFMQGKLL